MADELSFLGAIRAQPEDDTVRLIFADWLEEHGQQARAEFIRLQCRLADIDEFALDRPDLLDREWELLTVYRKRWQPAPPSQLAGYLRDSGFLRGFFARISVPAAALLSTGRVIQTRLKSCASPTAAGCWARSSGAVASKYQSL